MIAPPGCECQPEEPPGLTVICAIATSAPTCSGIVPSDTFVPRAKGTFVSPDGGVAAPVATKAAATTLASATLSNVHLKDSLMLPPFVYECPNRRTRRPRRHGAGSPARRPPRREQRLGPTRRRRRRNRSRPRERGSCGRSGRASRRGSAPPLPSALVVLGRHAHVLRPAGETSRRGSSALLDESVARGRPPRKLETPTVCGGRFSGFAPEPRGQLAPGADAELPVGTRQRAFDCVLRYKESRRDLTIRASLSDKHRDPPLGLGQLAARCCAAADPSELGACLVGPKRGAELLEDGQRATKGSPGGAPVLRAPLRYTEREERASVLERIHAPSVLCERALEADEGAWQIAPVGVKQRSAPSEDCERPRPVEGAGALLPTNEDPVRVVEPADRDQGLQHVRQFHTHAGLEKVGVAELVRGRQVLERRRRVA